MITKTTRPSPTKPTAVSVAHLSMDDKFRRLLERVSAAIPTGWLVSDECSGLVLVKLTMQGLEETGVKVMYR